MAPSDRDARRVNESSRLLYGTDNARIDVAVDAASVTTAPLTGPRSRIWYGVAAALLCTGALVSEEWHAPTPSPASPAFQAVTDANIRANAEITASSSVSLFPEFNTAMEASKDDSVDPCVDFYQYACGGWLANHEIPSDAAVIDASFYAVAQDNKKIIADVIHASPPVIGEFFQSCLRAGQSEVDADSVAFVSALVDRIHASNSTVELLTLAGELQHSLGISSFLQMDAQAQPTQPNVTVLWLAQGGLTLPSREYYLEPEKLAPYATLFLNYVTDLLAVGDLDAHNVTAFADEILKIELALAEISLSNAELRDPWATSTPYTLEQVEEAFPLVAAYLSGVQAGTDGNSNSSSTSTTQTALPADFTVIVTTPAFFQAQTDVLLAIPTQHLKSYLSFHVIDSFRDSLGEYFRRVAHSFHGQIRGQGALPTREVFCTSMTTSYLGTQLGEYYMREVFNGEARASAQSLVDQIEASMHDLLETEVWLDNATTVAALDKLAHVRNFIGGPATVTELPFVVRNDSFFDNVLSLTQLSAASLVASIGAPVDSERWDMFASTVNAYYDPSANKMVFPAAILQPPFYSASGFPAAANYARIGMVMGHELSHGFDDQGRNYDASGALRKWWSPRVSGDFTERAQCLARQYSSFPVLTPEGEDLGPLNGELTLGENIADNGGLHLSFQAYELYKARYGLTQTPGSEAERGDARLFFTAFAQQWCEKRTPAYSELLRMSDPHSPGRWRVNGPVMNYAKFAETFQCAAGTPMNPTDKCVIW